MAKNRKPEKIGGVELDYRFFDGRDSYNEGDDVEEKVLSVFREGKDPWQVLQEDERWPILYQLSQRREAIVEPMNLKKTDDVLEIGAGMGPITAALAQRCRHVDCVELSKRRAQANAWRNQGCNNIRIYVGNFERVKFERKYDVVTLIGVLEYAKSYLHVDGDPFAAMIRKAASLLRENGKLYVAIENKLGMKYFAGCQEDHLGIPFIGISGYGDHDIRTFTHSELDSLMKANGFAQTFFYYPYPDYKLPQVIFSDAYLPTSLDLLTTGENYDLPRQNLFNEQEALKNLAGTEEMKIFSNSFLIEAVKV